MSEVIQEEEEKPFTSLDENASHIYSTLKQGLEAARSKLLDRSLRNKLIHTNITSTKSRQIRVIDEKTEEVFAILKTGKAMTFAATTRFADTHDDTPDVAGESIYSPVIDDEVDGRGIASRHRDQKLQTRLTKDGLQKRLLSLYLEAQSIEDEQGVNVLYLAVGFLEWREPRQAETPRYAPLLLLPAELIRDGAKDTFKLKLRPDDLYTNFSMQVWLKEQFDIDLPDLPEDDEFSPTEYFSAVRAAIGDRKGWSVCDDEIVLAFFSFAKFLLWRDLDPANWPIPESLTNNDLLRRILLREEKDDLVDVPLIDDSERIDDVFRPVNLVHIADCDSSQAIAVQEALAGKNLVIQGPPGTGKSQTITNLIAGAVSQGKRVLFIAEKMPALNVVHDRLVKAKLGAICLELHSRKASKIQVLEQITAGMNAAAPPAWSSRAFDELEETADALSAHADRLHLSGSNGFSPFQLIGKLAYLKGIGAATPDFSIASAADWLEPQLYQYSKRVSQLAERVGHAGIPADHPWRGVRINTPDMLEQDRLRPLVSQFNDSAKQIVIVTWQLRELLDPIAIPVLGRLNFWIAPLNHLFQAPAGLEAWLADDRLLTLTDALRVTIERGKREKALREYLAPHVPVFDALAPGNQKLEFVIRAWLHLAKRPLDADVSLTDGRLGYIAEQALEFVDNYEQFKNVWGELEGQVTPDALEIDWSPVRKIIAGQGRSPLRIFSGDYRNAIRSLRSISRTDLPKDYSRRVALLDAMVDCRTRQSAINADTESAVALGELWRGKATDWGRVRSIISWIIEAKRFEPAFELRNSDILKFAEASRALPSAVEEREALIEQLYERRQILDDLCSATDCQDVLASLWQGTESDWILIKSIVDWVVAAATFEPELNLRKPSVLVGAAGAYQLGCDLANSLYQVRQAFAALVAALNWQSEGVAADLYIDNLSAEAVLDIADLWANHFQRLPEWPPIRDDLQWLRQIGCKDLSERIADGRTHASMALNAFLIAAYETMWGLQRKAAPEVERTRGDELSGYVSRFKKADQDRIRIASDQVARAHIDQRPSGSAGAVGILKDEAKKSRRHKPVRRLMEEAGEAVQRFKPVFLMSPLSVAQFLKPGRLSFDLCIIDEASQIRPEDAIGAIARCKQLVVVGDDKQLPPTNFFNRVVNDESLDDEDDMNTDVRAAAVKDVESILNLCSRFPERMLRWHYRSEHPALIATSNRNFYKNQLLLPPSVLRSQGDGQTGLAFYPVQSGGYDRGKTATNEIEAAAVVEEIISHAHNFPDQSLGVCTFSGAQRDAIRNLLEVAETKNPQLEAFIRRHKSTGDELFVRNLENVQGDERDVIFISVGYGRDASGKLTQNFGPVGREGGGRRLNVLITRAKKRCVVFSSIVAEDINSDGGKPGVLALKEFLKLAKDGFSDLASNTGKSFDSDFEESVDLAIRGLGYETHPQVGMAGFFIDIGVIDPRNADRYILGIECDGAAYHSSKYSRDRDRLRQEILERRGWKIHRIWSTDWFYQQEREIEKLRQAIEGAIAGRALAIAPEIYPDEEPELIPEEFPEVTSPDLGAAESVPPYIFYSGKAYERYNSDPHTLSNSRLAELAIEIVTVEQPIHQEEVARRLAGAFDLQKAGNRIQDATLRGLRYAARQNLLCVEGEFWATVQGITQSPRDRSEVPSAEMVRKSAMIAPAEWASGVRHALQANLAMEEAELIIEAARLLGFKRTGNDVEAAIKFAIHVILRNELEEDHLGRLRLIP